MNLMFMFTTMANIQYFAKLWHLQFMGSSRRPVSIIVYTILYQAAKPELSGYTRTSKFGCCLLRKLHKTTHPAIIDSLIDSRVLTILYFTVVSLLSALCDVVSWLDGYLLDSFMTRSQQQGKEWALDIFTLELNNLFFSRHFQKFVLMSFLLFWWVNTLHNQHIKMSQCTCCNILSQFSSCFLLSCHQSNQDYHSSMSFLFSLI